MAQSLFDYLPNGDPHRDYFKQQVSTDWRWSFKDYPPKNGLTCFSCFACGGGSTMGYKLAGIDVVGCLEIDPKMNAVYIKNHKLKHNFCMDIREFNKIPTEELPTELFNLDILDGSPPCSTFSMSGAREKDWGKEKKFREGQQVQTLDDLPFVFIETVQKLKPKTAVMENVEGLMLGNAWSYVQRIHCDFMRIGYTVRMELLKGERMGVPQTRHRAIFIATRLDFDLKKIDLCYNYAPILFKEIADGQGRLPGKDTEIARCLKIATPNEKSIKDCYAKMGERERNFNYRFAWAESVCPTLVAKTALFNGLAQRYVSKQEIIAVQTFPQDYDFINDNMANYICGMSVPPIMIKRLATRLIESGIFKNEGVEIYGKN